MLLKRAHHRQRCAVHKRALITPSQHHGLLGPSVAKVYCLTLGHGDWFAQPLVPRLSSRSGEIYENNADLAHAEGRAC